MSEFADFIIISGLSGAGSTTVLRTFEDQGFKAIDNLPLQFLSQLCELYNIPVAVSIDTRTLDFSVESFLQTLLIMKKRRPLLKFLFLECEESILLKRYRQTRRPHPLSGRAIEEALKEEFDLLRPIRALADEVFDTSYCSAEQSALWVRENFCSKNPKLVVMLTSFSYRHGLPPQADLVFDARFLRNPYYVDHLKPLTGKDTPVQEYIEQDPSWSDYMEACLRLVHLSLLGFKMRGRSYVTLAVGCTGGQHRSVFMIETLRKYLTHDDIIVCVDHREISSP